MVTAVSPSQALMDAVLPHLLAGSSLSVSQYQVLDRAAQDLLFALTPEHLKGESLDLHRLPLNGTIPRNLKYKGVVASSDAEDEVQIEVTLLADATGAPVVGVHSKPLPKPPFWDEVGEAFVTLMDRERVVRARLLLKLSGHANRAAFWGHSSNFNRAFLGEVEQLRTTALALSNAEGGTQLRIAEK